MNEKQNYMHANVLFVLFGGENIPKEFMKQGDP